MEEQKAPQILFVDDEPSLESLIRRQFRRKLRKKEYEFFFAQNGVEALKKIEEEPDIQVVITDINMPEMNGLTLLDKIHDLGHVIKTVVLSAYGDMKNIRTAMNRGAFDFLNKPIDFEDLEITMNRALEQVQQQRNSQYQLQQAQTQLIQSEKMSALGQLIAGVAHEMNNPVGFIAGNVAIAEDYISELIEVIQLYRDQFSDPGEEISAKLHEVDFESLVADVPELVASMKEGTDRIYHLSNSLRTFSRADISTKVAFNLHDGIDSTLLILKHRLKANEFRPTIDICKEYSELPAVICYPGQLNQVFMNLLANAIDALDEYSDGRTWDEMLESPNIITISTRELPEKKQVEIRISDNGPGIPEKVKTHVFDYLFTTKPPGKGTGLGLSISYQIVVEKHGGRLYCESEGDTGATFIIELPIE